MKQWHGSGCRFLVDGSPIGRIAWGPDNTDHLQLVLDEQTHELVPPVTAQSSPVPSGMRISFPDVEISFTSDDQGAQAILETVERYNAFAADRDVPESAATPPDSAIVPHAEENKPTAQKSRKGAAGDAENQLGFEGL
ncbi:hypothetical protein [Marinobacter salsuginis]|uniref:Uncharacterized protein n=1 Tax=Marinobacter salsuginis TaxID=418719 RepID=A0A5M3Q540_9GAMM|nr:hypothetical protein [Marinobacter salsuginis]GBO90181.1 hypothetical protein MSSD14B_38490 [Marinobacter salsuginis]